jgi:glycosyltransferase involved in cell wall biosynthesis
LLEHELSPSSAERPVQPSLTVKLERPVVVMIGGFGESLVAFRGDLLEALRAHGASVLVLVPGLSAEGQAWLAQRGIRYLDLPLSRTGTNPLADVRYCAWLYERLREEAPDVVLAYTIKPVVYGMLAASLARVPQRFALITGLGYAFIGGGARRAVLGGIARGLYALALRRASAVFFQNPDDRDLFKRMRLVPRKATLHIVNGSGIDTRRFAPAPLPEGRVVFLMIARLLGDKGVREYAQAARELKARHPNFVAQLVGWIDSNPDAIAQSELDGWIADGSIEFLGKLDDVRPALAACSVYVLPSYREGTPRTVLEAMAMGRPIITTDAPGCRETVVHGENGLLVEVRSAESLRRAMEQVLLEPAAIRRMGQRSRALAESKYDVRSVNESMLKLMGIS